MGAAAAVGGDHVGVVVVVSCTIAGGTMFMATFAIRRWIGVLRRRHKFFYRRRYSREIEYFLFFVDIKPKIEFLWVSVVVVVVVVSVKF